MSNVNQQSTAMCVRITEPAFAQVGCSLDQVQERVLRKATRMFADKLFEEGQAVVQFMGHPSIGHQFFGGPDVTYEVELTLVPVAEHKKVVSSLNTQLVSATDHVRMLQRQLDEAQQKIKAAKGALS